MKEDLMIVNTKVCSVFQCLFLGLVDAFAWLLVGWELPAYYACCDCGRNRVCEYGIYFVWLNKSVEKTFKSIADFYPIDYTWQSPPSELSRRLNAFFYALCNLLDNLYRLFAKGTFSNLKPHETSLILSSPSWKWLWKEEV